MTTIKKFGKWVDHLVDFREYVRGWKGVALEAADGYIIDFGFSIGYSRLNDENKALVDEILENIMNENYEAVTDEVIDFLVKKINTPLGDEIEDVILTKSTEMVIEIVKIKMRK